MSLAPETGPDPSPPLTDDIDSLIGLCDWIGTILYWQPASGTGQLAITAAPDPTVLDAKKLDALALYRRVEKQLAEARDLQIAISSSLDSVATPLPDETAPKAFVAYVSAIAAYLSDAGPLPSPITLTHQIRQLSAAVPPLQATATVTLSRQAAANTTTSDPRIDQVATSVPANVAEGLTSFAKRFRQSFPTLRLAVDGRRFDPQTLWAINVQLIQPTIAGSPTFFAPAPIAARPQSGIASIPDFGDFSQQSGWTENTLSFTHIDCDQLLAHCFQVIADLNAEPFTSALRRAEPNSAHAIARARSRLAKAYSEQQLTELFEPQLPTGSNKLLTAQAAYSDALNDSLVDAYAIDAMVASEVTWSKLPGSWSEQGLSLLGAVRPSGNSRSLPMASAKVDITGATQPRGTLCYPFRPRRLTANANVALPPLELLVTHVGLADTPSRAPTWLALVEPETVPMESGTGIAVPVVNRFQPTTPVLTLQNAAPTASTNPTFSQLFQWDYSIDIELQPVAQDLVHVVIRHNTRQDSRSSHRPATAESSLAAALFRFQTGFVPIASVLEDVVAGKSSAANIVRAIANLVTAVEISFDSGSSGESNDPSRNDDSSTRLAVSLSADPTATGKWHLTIGADGTTLPETLSVIPMTRERMPQPNVTVVRTNPLVISYDPQDPTASVVVRISLRQLDVRVIENSSTKAQVIRNFALRPQSPTAGRFILATPWLDFSAPVTPRIEGPSDGYDIASMGAPPPSGLLTDWLQMLFRQVFTAPATHYAKIVVAYEYSLSDRLVVQGRQPVPVRTPVLMTGLVLVGPGGEAKTPTTFAADLAHAIAAWMATTSPSRENGRLIFDLTLATMMPGDQVILNAPNLRLAVADIKELE